MLSRIAFSAVLVLALAGQVFCSPLPVPLKRDLVTREPEPLKTIPIYVKRQISVEAPLAKRQIPPEVPTKAPDGNIVPYERSVPAGESLNRRQIPPEVPTKAPDGNIVPYERSVPVVEPLNKRQIPPEVPTKAPDGVVVPYKRSGESSVAKRRQIAAELSEL